MTEIGPDDPIYADQLAYLEEYEASWKEFQAADRARQAKGEN